jgi:hypothetical protein
MKPGMIGMKMLPTWRNSVHAGLLAGLDLLVFFVCSARRSAAALRGSAAALGSIVLGIHRGRALATALRGESVAQPLGVAGADDDLELVSVDHTHHAVELLDRVDVDPRGR